MGYPHRYQTSHHERCCCPQSQEGLQAQGPCCPPSLCSDDCCRHQGAGRQEGLLPPGHPQVRGCQQQGGCCQGCCLCEARPCQDDCCQEGCGCRCCRQEGSWLIQACCCSQEGEESQEAKGKEAQGQEACCQEGCQETCKEGC